MAKNISFVDMWQTDVKTFLTALDKLRSDVTQYDALGIDSSLVDADVPSNRGIGAADVKAAVTRTRQVLGVQLVDLYKMRD